MPLNIVSSWNRLDYGKIRKLESSVCLILYLIVASDLGRCHYGDRVCLKKTINEYAVSLKNGRRELGLVPIDPLQVDEVKIEQGNNSPVNVNLKFHNLKCFGLSTAKIKDVM